MFCLQLMVVLFAIPGIILGHRTGHRENGYEVQDPKALLNQAITALGGSDNIAALNDVTYVGQTILRGKTLMLAISLHGVDNAGVAAGRQNITFAFDEPHIKQRVDRFAMLGPAFTFGRANLQPMDYSMVVKGGDKGFAAVVRGSYNLYNPGGEPTGYTDGLLAEYMISEAHKWDPLLISSILSNSNFTFRQEEVGAGVQLKGVHDENLGITVLFDPQTNLPNIIRSYEQHPFFGPSTHDLAVSNYIVVNGVQLPRRFKTIYNNKHLIGDYRADEVLANSQISSGLFSVPGNGTIPKTSIPIRDPEYSFAEIGETSALFLWGGAYTGSLDVLEATQPLADVPGLWVLSRDDPLGMRQAIIELDDGSVIVLDAPPHQSKIVMDWAKQTLGKPVTHVWPTHHHHDHAFGVVDFVASGAKLIVPEQAVHYYAGLKISNDDIITYKHGKPFILSDSRTRLALVDMKATVHAQDHGYAYIGRACPTSNSSTAVFDADHGNLNFLETFDHAAVQELLDALASDGVAANARFLASHGPAGTLEDVIGIASYRYPDHSPKDFRFRSTRCF
ncbi:hypothetical protein BKA66DRAFT_564639 [Pyrenochaeta sp. MPI-SDFR-AT-0127]|nr:hypothetical protein BKA66DRAFT_564639 [Pyrenochaeta sp. MPI-SDFR-AT-0127]